MIFNHYTNTVRWMMQSSWTSISFLDFEGQAERLVRDAMCYIIPARLHEH